MGTYAGWHHERDLLVIIAVHAAGLAAWPEAWTRLEGERKKEGWGVGICSRVRSPLACWALGKEEPRKMALRKS